MASSSSKIPASRRKPKTPDEYRFEKASLQYTVRVADGTPEWQNLTGPLRVTLSGDVVISQGPAKARCTATLTRNGGITVEGYLLGASQVAPFNVTFRCMKPWSLTYGEDEAKAKDQELAKVVETFDRVQLTLPPKFVKKVPEMARDAGGMINHLKTIMSGRITANPEEEWNQVIKDDHEAFEGRAQEPVSAAQKHVIEQKFAKLRAEQEATRAEFDRKREDMEKDMEKTFREEIEELKTDAARLRFELWERHVAAEEKML